MDLTNVERERLTDSMLKIQSARACLGEVDDRKIPQAEEVDACLETADRNLKLALGYIREVEGCPTDDAPA
jgi:hypothetical protein